MQKKAANLDRQHRSVGVAVLTYNGARHIDLCLSRLVGLCEPSNVLVVDSSSTDRTVDIARGYNVKVTTVRGDEFNHGLTREFARQMLGTDVVVFLTQDAILESSESLANLTRPILTGEADLTYGRQLPRPQAGWFERYLREFNYPADSHLRTLKDVGRYGARIVFCSDAFAAYSNDALDEVGGFPETLSHEDAIVAARILRAGGRIKYVAEARVIHSHESTLRAEFGRYFDAGYAREIFKADLAFAGGDQQTGRRYALGLARGTLANPWLIPYAIAHLGTKWLAFKLGTQATRWKSVRLRARLSGHPQYWQSVPFRKRESALSVHPH
jgi:rhamnosyltransferase